MLVIWVPVLRRSDATARETLRSTDLVTDRKPNRRFPRVFLPFVERLPSLLQDFRALFPMNPTGGWNRMEATNERRRSRRIVDRHGLTSTTAAIVLATVVVVIGVVGYIVLTAAGNAETRSSTVHSCAPSTSPQCGTTSHSSDTALPSGIAAKGTSGLA